MRHLTLLMTVLAALLVLVACQPQEPEIAEEDQIPEDMAPEEEAGDGDDGENGDVDADETVEFTAVDMDFQDVPDSVSAGMIEFVMTNEGASEHDMVVEELGDEEVVPLTSGGETGSGTADLEPGTYTVYCGVPGHRDAGMEATIEVE